MEKQTAVDILYKFLYEMEGFEGFDPYSFNHKDVFNKAKQMEREQIIEAAKFGNSFEQGDLRCEVYYKQTYSK
jgi:hypothetical protein